MSRFGSDRFGLPRKEASDSDDSGYVEDERSAPTGDHVDRVTLEQEDLPLVRHREPAQTTPRPECTRGWRNHQVVGEVVFHEDHHHFPKRNAPQDQGDLVNLPSGGQLLEKRRLFLIVGQVRGRLMECPIFTYGGKGISGREKETLPEYCSIRPLRVPVEGFKNQSPSNKVLDWDWVEWAGQMRKSMVVRLSDPTWRDKGTRVEVVGAISSGALQYAAERVDELMREATTSARR